MTKGSGGAAQDTVSSPRVRPGAIDALVVLVASVLTLSVYAPHLHHPFQFDDVVKIVDNAKLRDPAVFLRGFVSGGYQEDASRLVSNLTMSLDFRLFGETPLAFHRTSLALHLCNAWMLLLFGRALCRRFGAASLVPPLAATIFALHPLQSEAVLYNNARPNLLVTLFYLAALTAFLRAGSAAVPRTRALAWMIFVATTVLALLSKELAVTLVLMAPLLFAWPDANGAAPQVSWARLAPALGALVLLGLGVTLATGAGGAVIGTIVRDGSTRAGHWTKYLAFTVLEQSVVFLRYHAQALAPWPALLNVDHAGEGSLRQALISGRASASAVATALAAVAAVTAVACAAFTWRRRAPFAALCIVWPFVTHAPTSLFPREEVMVEYRTYLPMVGVCLLLAWCVERLLRFPPLRAAGPAAAPRVVVAAALLAASLAVGTAARARAWDSREALWRDSIAKAPRNPRALNNLGLALDDAEQLAQAERAYRDAIAVEPRYVMAHNNLGNLLLRRGRTADAVRAFEDALRVDPDYAQAHSNLGRALVAMGRIEEAIRHHERAVAAHADVAAFHTNFGSALAAMGRTDEAIDRFRRALALQPDRPLGHANLARTLAAAGRSREARDEYRRAVALDPGSADAHTSLGALLAQDGALTEALPHLRRAVELAPASADAHNNLASALGRSGRYREAVEHYQRALASRPDMAEARDGLAMAIALQASGSTLSP
jgi:tetratricopeptide (TPR) repeat protein